ncbi:MAG: diguanylate cyclase (GGDEF)-like protein [Candidatus Endobugula sp.]|jgi:diguanylate cyclase (GGDEF)-like protein
MPKMNELIEKIHSQLKKALSLLIIAFIFVTIISYWLVSVGISNSVKNQALVIAETLASQTYSHPVIPVQGTHATDKNSAFSLYHSTYVSKWHTRSQQALSDDFLQWAWPLLEVNVHGQESSIPPIPKQAIYRFEKQAGQTVLRYLHAIPTAQLSCVSCQNTHENEVEMIALLEKAGMTTNEKSQQYQLIGALSITIPLDGIGNRFNAQKTLTLLLIAVILLFSFIGFYYFILRLKKHAYLMSETHDQLARLDEGEKDKARLKFMGTHDALTGIPNRVLLLDRIKQAIYHASRRDQLSAVLFIDLDQFKLINDSLGHSVGDQLLIEVSKRILSNIREEDTLARQGGDEFIILLPTISNSKHAATVANKLVGAIRQPYKVLNHELHISASIGITLFPNDGVDVDTLLKNSDIAMYHAKSSGRNNYKFYNAELNANAKEKHKLVSNLRQDIDGKNFELYYQPIINIKTGTIDRLEVLIRWHSFEYGEVSPQQFIPLAEESGLIIAIGDWVLKTACLQLKEWQGQGYSIRKIAINLSARQFYQQGFATQISKLLKDTGIKASSIELEITEGLLMDNTDQVIEMMNTLTAMGIEMSIDDFGTGYSSLSYLKRFPIDTLKIDRSFIIDIHKGKHDLDIVKTIINLAHSMQMKVVAEGVEDTFQLDILEKLDCDFYQGFYFSKPVPAKKITSMIMKGG